MDEKISKAVEALRNGGVIVHPTDTCYGLACSIFSQKALEKLYRLKKMPFFKPVSILVSSLEQAKEFGKWNATAEKLAKQFWPGPLTLVLKRTEKIPKFLNPTMQTIGLRFPNHSLTLNIIKKLGHPIATTSVNITGQKELYEGPFLIRADFTIDGGLLPKVAPSTIVDVSGEKLKILRQGPIILSRNFAKPIPSFRKGKS